MVAWDQAIERLQAECRRVVQVVASAADWGIVLEYPLYRIRKRIDVVFLVGSVVVPVEMKVGADSFSSTDRRQAEEYGLDLRDFHGETRERVVIPSLWATGVRGTRYSIAPGGQVRPLVTLSSDDLFPFLVDVAKLESGGQIDVLTWDNSPYKPVPSIVEAATTIFAGHDVRALARADASNLGEVADTLVGLIQEARASRTHRLLFVTGVPGSGKTLAGLQLVHRAVSVGVEPRGDIVYLSGNTPLVAVLREALAEDEHGRRRSSGANSSLADIRREVRTRIQHIIDFLRDYVKSGGAPHEHVIVFDEAQRAWNAAQGQKKFNREESESVLLLSLMARHTDWAVMVCLVGGGQEINLGEDGLAGWGDALRQVSDSGKEWIVHGPKELLTGGPGTGGLSLGDLPVDCSFNVEDRLMLRVPLRSYRAPSVSQWVDAVLQGNADAASSFREQAAEYPLHITRSLERAKEWLRSQGRGLRRFGLAASSGARRLRAHGLGSTLAATDGQRIAHWYLRGRNDIRSSYCLEVPANEYTCQGLELDFVGLCWGLDFTHSGADGWLYQRLAGPKWQRVANVSARNFIRNKYRVLLTRAREGLVMWIPPGSSEDSTRPRAPLDRTYTFLVACGAEPLAD